MDKKGLVLCIPGYGHVNPSLPVVKELVDRGYQLDYCCTVEFQALIEQSGARFIQFPFDIRYSNSEQFSLLHCFGDIMEYTFKGFPFLKQLVATEHYDYIITDFYTIWGRLLAEHLQLPYFVLNPTFALHPKLEEPIDGLKKILSRPIDALTGFIRIIYHYYKIKRKYGVPRKGGFSNLLNGVVEVPHLCFTTKALQPQAELFPSNYYFTGPNVNVQTRRSDCSFSLETLQQADQVIYVSMGSLNANKRFLNCCIQAFKESPYLVVLNIGKTYAITDFEAPEQFIICDFAPQLEILPYVDVFISHAGMNSVHESLLFGVPVVAAPHAGDQFLLAKTLMEKELGVWINPYKITPDALRATVQSILENTTIHRKVAAIKQTLQNTGGSKASADLLESFLQES